KDMSIAAPEMSARLSRAAMARKMIRAVLAGANAAEAGQRPARPRTDRTAGTERDRQKAKELMQRYAALCKEGQCKERDMCAAAPLELDPASVGASIAGALSKFDARWIASYTTTEAPASGKERGKEEEIVQRLRRPVTVNFNEAPLNQVLDDLRAAHG